MSRPRALAVLALIAASAAVWLAGPSLASSRSASGGLAAAGGDSEASASAFDESTVRYLPLRRIPARMKCPSSAGAAAGKYRCLKFRGACAEPCSVRARMTVSLPGPNIGPVVASDHLEEDELVFVAFIVLNRPALALIKHYRDKARFRTRLTAVSDDGDEDVDRRSFRFKRD